jgi:D-alanine-D-alanine ligase-like ATP-grasp enzyme
MDNCPDCQPYQMDPRHFDDRLESLLSIILTPISPVLNLGRKALVYLPIDKWILRGLFNGLRLTGGFRTVPAVSSNMNLSQRTRVILEEAEQRNLQIKQLLLFGKPTNFFTLRISKNEIIFEGLPTMPIDHRKIWDFDDKFAFKQFLARHKFPHAEGRAFATQRRGMDYGKKLGFPLVVKPRTGSLTRHTRTSIQNEAELSQAIASARKIEYRYVVERHIPGHLFRVVLVNGQFVAAVHREPANITGDSQHTIEELVKEKNSDPRRGDRYSKTHSIHRIRLDDPVVQNHLERSGLSNQSVLAAGQKVYLYPKVLMISGAELHDVTDQVHPDNQKLCERLAALFPEKVIGFDLIAEDLSQPYTKQSFAFIEANSLPQIEMHHYPMTGTPRNIAKLVFDQVLGQ